MVSWRKPCSTARRSGHAARRNATLMLCAISGSLSWLTSCSDFGAYPEGDLCENAVVDEDGRAVFFPESRICRRKKPTTRDLDDPDAGRNVEED